MIFLNVSLDADEAAWREAVAEHEIKGVHVRVGGWGADVAKSYQVKAIPSYYLVDSQGLIVERLSGVWDTDEIVATIEKSCNSLCFSIIKHHFQCNDQRLVKKSL